MSVEMLRVCYGVQMFLISSCIVVDVAGQHNDSRMNLAIALTAARYGAAIANYTEVTQLLKATDPLTGKKKVCGARCRDVITGTYTRTYINIILILLIEYYRFILLLQWCF